ncbi:MAG: RHS repeat-associated core domain-containing protein [Nitrospira sp.]|nr:RHS repeat-associated core domain-containing protein [Nitrospira sp.]
MDQTGTVEQPYTYTGREFDAESGLYYYRARYYDPTMGRFLSEDPIASTGGLNLYAYVGNDPLNWIDLSGRTRANSSGGKGGGQAPSKSQDLNNLNTPDSKDLKSGTLSEPPPPNVRPPTQSPSVFCDLRFAQCLKGCTDCPIPPAPDPHMGKVTQVLRFLYKGGCIAYCGTEFAICRALAATKGQVQ